jgi:hypothetical protein
VARIDGVSMQCDAPPHAVDRCAATFLGRMRAQAERAYIDARGLQATDAEIEAVYAYERAFQAHDRAQRARKLTQLEARLQSSPPNAAERSQLEAFRAVLVRLARYEADVDAGTEAAALPRESAAAWVEQAKLDADLHRRFAGSVGIRASGMYAHGARSRLLRDHLDQQRIEWLDPSFEQIVERAIAAVPAIEYRGNAVDFTPFWLRPIPPSYMPD